LAAGSVGPVLNLGNELKLNPERPRSRRYDGCRMTPNRANIFALVITVLSLSQMAGYALGFRTLRGIGAATCMAPCPKVFSDVDGLETFASEFTVRGTDRRGQPVAIEITPEVYSRLDGCYNRRNVYGAALSYGPRLPEPLWTAVFCYGLRPRGPLRLELGLPPDMRGISVEIRTKTSGRHDVWTLRAPCTE
jgi:hypothetical protein